ncbi:MAG: ATP-binding cassette domain-containing protein [Bacteroidota bacterium]
MPLSSLIVNKVSAKWQGNTVLDDISFELQANENLLITGNSGSGKSLLAKALSGKLFHFGTIDYLQNDKKSTPHVIFVEQHYHFKNLSNVNSFYYQQRFNSFDADDAATVFQELEKVNNATTRNINDLLLQFDLLDLSASPLLHLSSGEHKRFQLVKALLQSPEYIIFDEPFTGLDLQTRTKLKKTIDNLAANGTTCIVICNPVDAPACITHVLELEKGKIKQLIPKSAFVAETISYHQHLDGTAIFYEPLKVSFTEAIAFNNVSVSYGSKSILKGINWNVQQGEKWLLKGKNGAGKSTLLSLITGDNPQAYANDIYLFGKKRGTGESIWDIKKQIGYVSPELQWYFDTGISCYQVVASGLFDTIGLFRTLTTTQNLQVKNWLQYFGLSSHSQQLLAALPAGKQRLALLARAMVKNPPVLILDEPCQGLDQHQKEHFIQLTDTLCVNSPRTLIYVSHYAEDVPACVKKVLELKEGSASIYDHKPLNNTHSKQHE